MSLAKVLYFVESGLCLFLLSKERVWRKEQEGGREKENTEDVGAAESGMQRRAAESSQSMRGVSYTLQLDILPRGIMNGFSRDYRALMDLGSNSGPCLRA